MRRRLMSHETSRSPEKDGDRLVYEPLERKWAGYHARHCGCGRDWLEAHAVPAGFTVITRGKTGYYGLVVVPGLTEGVGAASRADGPTAGLRPPRDRQCAAGL